MHVDQEDIDLMAKLFDYAALSDDPGRTPVNNSTPRRRSEAPDTAVNCFPQSIVSTSDDSTVIEPRNIRTDPLAVSEELDWPTGYFNTFPDVTNDWSFLGQRWSTHFSEG